MSTVELLKNLGNSLGVINHNCNCTKCTGKKTLTDEEARVVMAEVYKRIFGKEM